MENHDIKIMLNGGGYKFELKRNFLLKYFDVISHKKRSEMFQLFMTDIAPSSHDKVIDIGVSPENDYSGSQNYFEKHYPHLDNLTVASIEDASNLEKIYKNVRFVRLEQDANFPFSDNEFDILFCSAVIEHVGNHEKQLAFLQEIARVSKKVFLTTPNKYFPVEFHTFLPLLHWLPQQVHQRILNMLGMKFWGSLDNLNLLTKRKLLAMAGKIDRNICVKSVKLFGITSNLVLIMKQKGDRNETR